MNIPTNSEHVRDEGTWHYAELDWMNPTDAERVRTEADRLGIDLAFCGRGAKAKLDHAITLITDALRQEDDPT